MDEKQLFDVALDAKSVLDANQRGKHTLPSAGPYTHQWLWDSCFIAIGLRHYDITRAQDEILSLLKAQWSNGMLPHMIFSSSDSHSKDKDIWRSWLSLYAPDDYATSGITQPPMLAEAIVQIGKKLDKQSMRSWYQTVYPALLKYHQWLYKERDPHHEGLVLQIHPYETGLDNTPPWIHELHEHHKPWWVRGIEKANLQRFGRLFRRDLKHIKSEERINDIDALLYYSALLRLRRKRYDIDLILKHSLFSIEDLTFNSIFIRANQHLVSIAKAIGREIDPELLAQFKRSEVALDNLWDAYSSQYYSRDHVSHKLIKIPTIATLMPLYAGCISKERAAALVKHLYSSQSFGTNYPIPSVPASSNWFQPTGYWQGPTWLNTNWLIIDGLKRYGFKDVAEAVSMSSVEMVQAHGCYEYFNPLDGTPAGIPNFSWTASLAIDLIQTSPSMNIKNIDKKLHVPVVDEIIETTEHVEAIN